MSKVECEQCLQSQQEIERYEQELQQKELLIEDLRHHNDHLKQKNQAEKKKHTEVNNEIIMSNVRYQQTLSQMQTTLQKYVREKEDLLRMQTSKEVECIGLKAENTVLRQHMERLYERFDLLIKGGEERDSKKIVAPIAIEDNKSGALLPIQVPPTHIKEEHKEKKKIRQERSQTATGNTMGAEKAPNTTQRGGYLASQEKHSNSTQHIDLSLEENTPNTTLHSDYLSAQEKAPTMQENNEVTLKPVKKEGLRDRSNALEEVNPNRRYQLRTVTNKMYMEPSLRLKLRRGDPYPFIIKDKEEKRKIFPHDNKENAINK